MDLLWALGLLAIVLASLWLLRPFRRSGGSFYWPWLDGGRGDRAQQEHIAEEEMRRSASEERDRDPAP